MAEHEERAITLIQTPPEHGIELGEAQLSGSQPPPESPLPPAGLQVDQHKVSAAPSPSSSPSDSAKPGK